MLSANATKRCRTETGSDRMMDMATNGAIPRLAVVLGVAECAAAQTVHFAASVVFEWWCAASATAEQNVSNRHRHAIRLENRITATL